MTEKPSVTVSGTVRKVVQFPNKPEEVQIAIEGPDLLPEEIRIENTLTDKSGQDVRLKTGAKVEVTIKATPESIVA
jgi:hypothetical protein